MGPCLWAVFQSPQASCSHKHVQFALCFIYRVGVLWGISNVDLINASLAISVLLNSPGLYFFAVILRRWVYMRHFPISDRNIL